MLFPDLRYLLRLVCHASPRSTEQRSQVFDKTCRFPSEHTSTLSVSALFNSSDDLLRITCLPKLVLLEMSNQTSLSPQQLALLPHNNAGPTLLIVSWTLTACATVFLGLRIYCKLLSHRSTYWDDWVLLAAWVS